MEFKDTIEELTIFLAGAWTIEENVLGGSKTFQSLFNTVSENTYLEI
jgi:hypothetical protein